MIKRPKTGQQICQECFFYVFETEIHNTIVDANLFQRGERVAIGASGGKGEKPRSTPSTLLELTLCRFDCACSCAQGFERTIRLWG